MIKKKKKRHIGEEPEKYFIYFIVSQKHIDWGK